MAALVALALAAHASGARADDVLHVGNLNVDRPTLIALGVQLLVSGDDDHDATVSLRYRASTSASWHEGLPLFRVRPESVAGRTVPQQFAGSVFDLTPATAYDLELHAVDPDGTDQTLMASATTRAVPSDPSSPHAVNVTDATSLKAALSGAKPGNVITLANGTYAGLFRIDASGTADQPIVIRGASEDAVVLDGGGCTGCNVLEVYGSFVHVEQLTLAHASRALRFQGTGAEGNAVRYVHVKDVVLGFGSNADQKDFYLCDNTLQGRLAWPAVYSDDGGAHANDDGIHVEGNGHVVCHNQLVGFGDALKTEQDGARAVDFYGNEVLSAYDNGIELDGSEGNARCFRNRFTNTYATISFQPIFGGPAYAFRNVVVNVANEQMKFHALGGTPVEETSGILVYHNTFVSPQNALANHTSDTCHHFAIENNLFVASAGGRTMDFTSPVDDGTFDYNGFFPDGIFDFDFGSGYQKFSNFAMARAAQPGFEAHGRIVSIPIFESGLNAPTDYKSVLMPQDVTLAGNSDAIDRGLVLTGINDDFQGAAPDLGALERGCPLPIFGVRPAGTDERNEPMGCASKAGTPGNMGAGSPDAGTSSGAGGNGSGVAGTTGTAATSKGTGGSGATPSAGAAGGNGASASQGGAGSGAGSGGTNAASKHGGCGCHVVGGGRAPTAGAFGLGLLFASVALRGRARRRAREARARSRFARGRAMSGA